MFLLPQQSPLQEKLKVILPSIFRAHKLAGYDYLVECQCDSNFRDDLYSFRDCALDCAPTRPFVVHPRVPRGLRWMVTLALRNRLTRAPPSAPERHPKGKMIVDCSEWWMYVRLAVVDANIILNIYVRRKLTELLSPFCCQKYFRMQNR